MAVKKGLDKIKEASPVPFWCRTCGNSIMDIIAITTITAMALAIVTPGLTSYVAESRVRRALPDVQVIAGALANFHRDNGRWPVFADLSDAEPDWKVLVGRGKNPDVGVSGWVLPEEGSTGNEVGLLEDQLMRNTTGYPLKADGGGWAGPYLETVPREDPWGCRYLVNVEFLRPNELSNKKSVFVLSAGPNKTIDTPYSVTTGFGLVEPQGDDIVCRIK
jgi:hypothetical protein